MKKSVKKSELAERTRSDSRWNDVVARNAARDGSFVYTVESTGVYCKPSYGGRTPAPENVRFYDNNGEAEAAGYRPCLRCRPDLPPLAERQATAVADLCRRMEASETALGLRDLAEISGMSMFHLHRVFKAVTGVTPKAYMNEIKNRRMRDNLASERTITAAIYSSGYGSSSRFYEQSSRRLGMTPKTFRRCGANASIVFSVAECWLGFILVAASEKGICAITMGERREPLVKELYAMFSDAELISGDKDFDTLVSRVVSFVEQPGVGLELPLDVRGTAFQHKVWKALLDVPCGETVSYAELARRIGAPKAVRAVAQACTANKLAVAIPCHRVVRSDGDLAGYRWEAKRKRALIKREKEFSGA